MLWATVTPWMGDHSSAKVNAVATNIVKIPEAKKHSASIICFWGKQKLSTFTVQYIVIDVTLKIAFTSCCSLSRLLLADSWPVSSSIVKAAASSPSSEYLKQGDIFLLNGTYWQGEYFYL